MNNETIVNDFKTHSKNWISNFNNANFQDCIDAYTEDAIVIVKNVGEFKGKAEITSFWTELTKTANHIEYSNTNIKVIDENTIHLSSDWKMNIGEGIITLEEWKRQEDKSWKLTQDEFEVLKQY